MMSSKRTKIGIMGFGRIGRDFYRLAMQNDEIEIVAISDIGRAEILHYLLMVEGTGEPVKLDGNYLVSGKTKTRIVHGVKPGDVPWDMFEVDLVIDATHKYCSNSQMSGYLQAGAKRVIISALPRDIIDRVVVMGVNDGSMSSKDALVSAGSSTTNAIAMLLNVLGKKFPIQQVMYTTIHAYTSDQPLQDTVGKDFRRSRSAAENIIPNITPSAKWISEILPGFKGKIEGIALNVPVPRGSCLDMTLVMKDDSVSVEDINKTMWDASKKYVGLIETTADPIVSSDVIGNSHSLVFDTRATMKSNSRMIKILSWYDNGLGQANHILKIVEAYRKLDLEGVAS